MEPALGLDPRGLFANGGRVRNIARARELLGGVAPQTDAAEGENDDAPVLPQPCPSCGGRMVVIETFAPGNQPSRRSGPDPPTVNGGRTWGQFGGFIEGRNWLGSLST